MTRGAWSPVHDEIERWALAGREVRLWLRDDDAVEASPALDRLLALVAERHVPLMLCVIPLGARPSLAEAVAGLDRVEIAMHGVGHVDHALPGGKKEELVPARGADALLTALDHGRARLIALFGPRAGRWFAPPWNRIAPEAARLLPRVGIRGLSCFGAAIRHVEGLAERNVHVDLIDWRGGRVGRRADWVAERLAAELAAARAGGYRPVGVLAHHLDHDETAWQVLAELIDAASSHAAVRWIGAGELLEASTGAG